MLKIVTLCFVRDISFTCIYSIVLVSLNYKKIQIGTMFLYVSWSYSFWWC